MKSTDLAGKRFGRLVCQSEAPRRAGRPYDRYWVCICDCGGERVVLQGNLTAGRIQSCGCYRREFISQTKRKHGHSHGSAAGASSPTYNSWVSMRARCLNPEHPDWWDYGGRGITICQRWSSFANFLEDMGERPAGRYSIDRIDNELGYFQSNCRWATPQEQANNQRYNHRIQYAGKTRTAAEWERIMGLPPHTIVRRAERGWTAEMAIGTPVLPPVDLTGQRFNAWLVLGKARNRGEQRYWCCRCQCGEEKEVNQYTLVHGTSRSCGCSLKGVTPNRPVLRLTLDGETRTVSEWARKLGIKPLTLHYRVRQGWSAEQVLCTPLRGKKH